MFESTTPMRDTSWHLPTLSTQGWITGIHEKVDRIFAWYLTSQYHQTLYHLNHVRSLQYTVKNHFSDPGFLANQIQTDLETLLSSYIDHVIVKVTYVERDEKNVYDFRIEMTLTHQGYQWQHFKDLHMKDSKFTEIININNVGVSLVDA